MDDAAAALVHPLISAAELAASLRMGTAGEEALAVPVVLDVRWTLAGSDEGAFEAGHIPRARFVDLDRELAAPPGVGGRHPLPDPGVIAALMQRTGIEPGVPVVVCGQRDTSIAARAWWLLRWVGHRDVRVLDGGFEAWRAAGLPLEAGVSGTAGLDEGTTHGAGAADESDRRGGSTAGAAPVVRGGAMPTVDADGAAALGAGDGSVLLDARAAERYRGDVEPIDPAPGHIPGAVNLPLSEIHAADGRVLPASALRAQFAAAGVRPGTAVAASCGSGVTACALILAGEVAGLQFALYPGSYSGWCALGRPVERAS